MLFKSSSMSSILKGTVLSRRLLRLVPMPVKARTLLQISFFSFGTKRRAGPRPHAILLLMGQGLSKSGSWFSNVSAQNMLKIKGYLHFLLFVRLFHGLWIKNLCGLKSVGLLFQLSARKKGERSQVKFFSWLLFQPPSLDNYPSTLHA